MSHMWVIVLMVLPFISGMLTMAAILLWRGNHRHHTPGRWFAMPRMHFMPITTNRRNWANPNGKPYDPDTTGVYIPRSWMPQ